MYAPGTYSCLLEDIYIRSLLLPLGNKLRDLKAVGTTLLKILPNLRGAQDPGHEEEVKLPLEIKFLQEHAVEIEKDQLVSLELHRLETGTSRLIPPVRPLFLLHPRLLGPHPHTLGYTTCLLQHVLLSWSLVRSWGTILRPSSITSCEVRAVPCGLVSRCNAFGRNAVVSNVEVLIINLQTVTTLPPIRNISASRILSLRRIQPTMILMVKSF